MDQPATKEPATKNATFRGACLTSYKEADWTELPCGVSYIAWSDEVCPTTQRKHKQAWAYSDKAMRLTGWKKLFPGDHIEQMKGTFVQNDIYCSKAGVLKELGERPMDNGKKRKLAEFASEVILAARSQTSLCQVTTSEANASLYVQYHGGIQKLYNATITKVLEDVDKDFAPEVIYVWGSPGSGKTRLVHQQENYKLFKIPPADGYKWKDNYAGQDAVLYDNVSATNIKDPSQFLCELDRYYMQVPVKGGYIGWRPRRIYITSVLSPDNLSRAAGFTHPAEFVRRLTRVEYLNSPES